ncbi:hypothetical protein DsansV1_C35g0229641 [Dioscorea sansibarensis]
MELWKYSFMFLKTPLKNQILITIILALTPGQVLNRFRFPILLPFTSVLLLHSSIYLGF